MCVYSMVLDHFAPRFPWPEPPPPPETPWSGYPVLPVDWKAIDKSLDDFRKAAEAAKLIDKLTGQPDCEDPSKKALEERVAILERELASLKAKNGGAP